MWLGDQSLSLIVASFAVSFAIVKASQHFYSKMAACDAVDPSTGLNGREKHLVQQSWGLARKDLKASGTGLFLALFKAHPEYQSHFKSFCEVPVDQLVKSGPFVAHAMNVANAVSLIVDSLDDATTLVALLKRVGKSHSRHNITEKHFQNLNAVIVDFLEAALGRQNFGDECRKSWVHTLDVAFSVIKTELSH